ncbi:hypothetical protein L195_g022636, partial [Trifolium pratense]
MQVMVQESVMMGGSLGTEEALALETVVSVKSGMEWNGAEWNKSFIPSFGYFRKERNKIE